MFIGSLSTCKIGGFGESSTSNHGSNFEGRLKFISLNNLPYQTRPAIIEVNSNETPFYPFTAGFNKCDGSCNAIDDLYTRVCVPNKVTNMNIKVFNLMSGINETRFLV